MGCSDSECMDWRRAAKEHLGAENCIDPMTRDFRGKERSCVREIVELDKLDIMKSDAVLVNYDKPSVGTSMEILFAWEQRKVIIVVAPAGVQLSPWLVYHATEIVHNFQDAYATLDTYDDDVDVYEY